VALFVTYWCSPAYMFLRRAPCVTAASVSHSLYQQQKQMHEAGIDLSMLASGLRSIVLDSVNSHTEHIRSTQCKLREGSVAIGNEMLRFAQHDKAGPVC
jgi:hypothetical protein